MTRYVLMAFGLVVIAQRGQAEPPPDPSALEFFEREVRPLLVGRCQECHGAEKQKGDLRLDSRAAVLAGGSTGPAVVPGKAGESLLVDAINYGDLYQMPPKSKLPASEIAVLTRWIDMGAPWPGDDRPKSAAKERHLRPRGAREALELPADPGPRAPRSPGPRLAEGRRSIGSSWRRWRPRASRRRPRPTGAP